MSLLPEAAMLILSTGAALFNPLPQKGEAGYRDVPTHYFNVCYENDSAFDVDCNYSHGTRLSYAQACGERKFWGVSLTQNIYTPEIHTRHAVPNQHPYAGTMGLGGAYIVQGPRYGYTTEVQVGTTGNASLARYIQNTVHDLGRMPRWDGWGEQVPSEVTAQLTQRFDYNIPWLTTSLSHGWETDAVLTARADIGTVRMAGGTGLTLRIGRNLPDSMQVTGNQPGAYGIGLISKPGYDRDKISYFLVAGVYAEYVARDITIDGGVFHHFNKTCSRKPWQVEGRLGIGVSYQGIDYFGGVLLRSRSYRTQDEISAMGAFSVGWRW